MKFGLRTLLICTCFIAVAASAIIQLYSRTALVIKKSEWSEVSEPSIANYVDNKRTDRIYHLKLFTFGTGERILCIELGRDTNISWASESSKRVEINGRLVSIPNEGEIDVYISWDGVKGQRAPHELAMEFLGVRTLDDLTFLDLVGFQSKADLQMSNTE